MSSMPADVLSMGAAYFINRAVLIYKFTQFRNVFATEFFHVECLHKVQHYQTANNQLEASRGDTYSTSPQVTETMAIRVPFQFRLHVLGIYAMKTKKECVC